MEIEADVTNEYTYVKEVNGDSEKMRKRLGDEMYSLVRKINLDPPDALVFLDKSARPAYWFFDSLWKEMYPDESQPDIKFINLGMEKTMFSQEAYYKTIQDPEIFKAHVRADAEQVEKVRKHFSINGTEKTYLDNKERILILDEYANTGTTLATAEALFQGAFRERYFDGIETEAIFSHEPPWLSINKAFDKTALGVQDRTKDDFTVRPIIPHPPEVRQLKHELKMLAEETAKRYKEEE